MRYVDWLVQTVILIAGVIALVLAWHQPAGPLTCLLITQLVIGLWQMVSSAISFVKKSNLWRYKRIHLLLASCYLITVYVFSQSTISFFYNTRLIWTLFLTVPSMSLALYYYFITWKSTFISMTKRGSFLPNINF